MSRMYFVLFLVWNGAKRQSRGISPLKIKKITKFFIALSRSDPPNDRKEKFESFGDIFVYFSAR